MWSHLGTIHCLSGRGRCWNLRGGDHANERFFDGICNNAKSLPKCQKPAFLTFINKFRFPLGPPTLLRTKNQFYILCTQRIAKNFPNRRLLFLSLSVFFFWGGGGGGRGHLKYFRLQRGWEHPTKFLMKRESS